MEEKDLFTELQTKGTCFNTVIKERSNLFTLINNCIARFMLEITRILYYT
jgi:hypothetical protein